MLTYISRVLTGIVLAEWSIGGLEEETDSTDKFRRKVNDHVHLTVP